MFICDTMLGKLAKYLRIIGLDTVYIKSIKELAEFKNKYDSPVLFTRRKTQKLLYSNSLYIESDNISDQIQQIKDIIKPYIEKKTIMKRCVRCNTLLRDVDKDDIETFVPEFIFHKYDNFKACPLCMKIFWRGSHAENMEKWIKRAFL